MVVKGSRDVNATARTAEPAGDRWLYGVNAVLRRLEVQAASVREIRLLPRPTGRLADIAARAAAARIPVRQADEAALRQLVGSGGHQGVAARAEAFRYADLSAITAAHPGPFLMLDQIQDPHNLGALLRTAAAVGMAAVIIPRHGAVGVTPAVEKVSAGAACDVAVCQVANVSQTLKDLAKRGLWSIALVLRDAPSLFEIEIPSRVVLVLGGESGLRPLVERTCDLRASIPVRPGVESLNASVAGAIAMYEVLRRGRLA